MWTLTFAKVYPDSWCGNMHAELVRLLGDACRERKGVRSRTPFGGVRVTEVHPNGHGIHFHWIIRGRLSLALVRKCAKKAGFGHVFIARDTSGRFRAVDGGAAGYVAKYLSKGDKLTGTRAWACIGDYNGTKTRDIEFDSQSNRVFREAYREAKLAGAVAPLCFAAAKIAQRKFDHFSDVRDGAGVESGTNARGAEIGGVALDGDGGKLGTVSSVGVESSRSVAGERRERRGVRDLSSHEMGLGPHVHWHSLRVGGVDENDS